jgi:hypothetical protein
VEGDTALLIQISSKANTDKLTGRAEALIQETLRQICIRNNYGSKSLIKYLNNLKDAGEKSSVETGWNETQLTKISWDTVNEMNLNRVNLEKCVKNSFKPYFSDGIINQEIHKVKLTRC